MPSGPPLRISLPGMAILRPSFSPGTGKPPTRKGQKLCRLHFLFVPFHPFNSPAPHVLLYQVVEDCQRLEIRDSNYHYLLSKSVEY